MSDAAITLIAALVALSVVGVPLAWALCLSSVFSLAAAGTLGTLPIFVQRLFGSGIAFFEEPVRTDDCENSAALAKELSTRIAGYETEYLAANCRRLIAMRAVDIIQPDLSWTGGITECRKIADLAHVNFMECTAHMYSSGILLAASLHFACAIPNGVIQEYDTTDNALRDDLLVSPFIPVDGVIHLSDKPGLGIEINEDVVEKYRVRVY